MTVVEQVLLIITYVLLIIVGLQRTHIRETRKLLRQANADRVAAAQERREHLARETAWLGQQTGQIQRMTDELRRARETHTP
ncbi:hypothetical protein AB0J63_17750 [Streptosporangium canum]|uniref:hypothetical protein n=1 Tax=Streptosporangium canum TaxID=324952 RepID=UPI00342D8C47